MRANKSHIYLFVYKDNDGYYTIVIALNIEHISVVANIVNGIERFLDISLSTLLSILAAKIRRIVENCKFI